MPLSKETKVGVFITLSLVLVVAALVFVAYKKGVFQAEEIYTLSSEAGEGLSVGMPLMFSGFKIGRIVNLELDDRGLVLVSVSVPTRHKKWLRADSTFILERPLIGSAKLSVVTRNLDSPPLSPKTVPSISQLDDINETIKKIQPALDRISLITEHVEKITALLARKESLLEMAVGDKDSVAAVHGTLRNLQTITRDVGVLLKKTDDGLYGKKGVVPEVVNVLEELRGDLVKVGKTLDNLEKVSAEAAGAAKDFKLLRHDIDGAVNSIGNLINDLNRMLPLRSERKIELP